MCCRLVATGISLQRRQRRRSGSTLRRSMNSSSHTPVQGSGVVLHQSSCIIRNHLFCVAPPTNAFLRSLPASCSFVRKHGVSRRPSRRRSFGVRLLSSHFRRLRVFCSSEKQVHVTKPMSVSEPPPKPMLPAPPRVRSSPMQNLDEVIVMTTAAFFLRENSRLCNYL